MPKKPNKPFAKKAPGVKGAPFIKGAPPVKGAPKPMEAPAVCKKCGKQYGKGPGKCTC